MTVPDIEMNGACLADDKPELALQESRLNIQLNIFREIVGINPPPALRTGNAKRPAQNKGIYRRTCQAESKARLQYYACAATFNTCFLLQIVVAAALTAIGAAKGPHIAVTVLGAVNTIIAGVLTYLKGQGLPNRLRQYQSELRKVREYVEERERDFSRLDCKLDLDHEIAIIWRMYEAVRQNNEDNFPDTYHNFTGGGGTKPAETPGVQTLPVKQINAIPDGKATANGTQVEVSAIEVPPGLSDRSSNRNSIHVPIDGDGNLNGKRPEINAGHPNIEKPAAWDPSAMDIEPVATGKLMEPYAGLRHMNAAISSGRPASSIERSPNRQSRHASTEGPAVSRERPNTMADQRTSLAIPSGAKDGSSHRNSAFAPLERPLAPTETSSNRNSAYEHTPPERLSPSGTSSKRNSAYIPAERPRVPIDPMLNVNTEHVYAEEPTAPTPSRRSSNRNSPYTQSQRPTAPDENGPRLENANIPTDMVRAPSEGSANDNTRLATLSRRNSTTPVKQFYTAAQRRG